MRDAIERDGFDSQTRFFRSAVTSGFGGAQFKITPRRIILRAFYAGCPCRTRGQGPTSKITEIRGQRSRIEYQWVKVNGKWVSGNLRLSTSALFDSRLLISGPDVWPLISDVWPLISDL